ncbi:MAG: 16S rRNA (cytosine(967)-C(5))-methyltransferase RsmB [Nitrospirota bacterium]|nr:16S rRNA (cytosine(967)-C(5))-methyltransferase RsmB [Nitrospirota bacterium]MDP2383812.1 16S rRNA (cytosine(967)-C(5))-methyltransferase RsmB [Nitrospirota bacterium]
MASGPRSLFTAQTAPSARAIALSLLVESDKSEEGVDVLLDRALARCSFDSRDRALTVELTYGVLRRLATIDWRLEPVLDKPLLRLPVAVQMVLRLGAYQLLFLDRIPQSAAVNESVNLTRAFACTVGRDWSGLVNAVLRSLLRHPPEPWPSMDHDPVQALAVRYSIPGWLSRRWVERLGPAAAEAACAGVSVAPPMTLRVNQLVTTRDALLEQFAQAGIAAKQARVSPFGIVLEDGGLVPSIPGFQEGAFYVEDEAAQLIPLILDPRPGEVILDACAAPGGKSTHLADLMQNKGTIYAVDRKGTRLDLLRSNCSRLNVQIVVPIVGDIRQPREWVSPIETAAAHVKKANVGELLVDRILVDAPCSGLGVLRRHPEAKWRKDEQALPRHQALQSQILEAVAPCLRPGGVLVYSTCSTEPEENEDVIERFCRTHREFQRESVIRWLPPEAQGFVTEQGAFSTVGNQLSMDGFYAARLRKGL